ncbi:hypothetical protein DFH06DRAFT_1246915 [Mycena polygramma]|nr:hypothetical protein DFH06DRAFT_1246915 [Mycena polygramma]
MTRFASSAKEVRINPRAMSSTSPRRASAGHKYVPNSRSVMLESGDGQNPINRVIESCHAGLDTRAEASKLLRHADEANAGTTAESRKIENIRGSMPIATQDSSRIPNKVKATNNRKSRPVGRGCGADKADKVPERWQEDGSGLEDSSTPTATVLSAFPGMGDCEPRESDKAERSNTGQSREGAKKAASRSKGPSRGNGGQGRHSGGSTSS